MANNISNSPNTSIFFEPSPIKLVILTALVMFACIIGSGAFIYVFAQNQAKLYTDNQVANANAQAIITLKPMLLAKDTLSMNFYLGTLARADFIQGATLVDAKGKLLARSGSRNGPLKKSQLFSQQLLIGELNLYINSAPSEQFFKRLLWIFVVLAAISAMFTLVSVAYFAKRILREFSNQYKPLLEHRFSMELAQVAKDSDTIVPTEPQGNVVDNHLRPQATDQPVSLAIVDLDIEQPIEAEPLSGVPSNDPQNEDNEQLVSLLKPDTQQRMPHFKPFNNQTDTEQKYRGPAHMASPEIELRESIQLFEEQRPAPSPTVGSQNPLLRAHPHEEQLDLYSLEHQTELSLKARDAAYLLFIDCSSGRAPIEDIEEHQALLTQYRRLITLVINIYGGVVELLANGDIRVMFDDRDPDDNHGIAALCAAKLFNQLYQYYNHRQITRMQPTLNIQISLVRGNRDKIELLREESHFLTCTTASNQLISHTPLSEVKALKNSLLENAKTERQDEDKILILALSPSYQELLEKQARHLVKSFN
ncbi:MAG: hypothetical protein MJK10_04210 [Pseudomonadales bacterium]|nr:hypothetical protein [Pseudomonadales bacterium]NRA15317.1 hypothetical protein [Oceanospirillaceae bacterium]